MLQSIKQTNMGNLFTIFSSQSALWNSVFPLNKYPESWLSYSLTHEEIISVAGERLIATFKLPKNLKLYHQSICWMSRQAIYHTPVIKPESGLQVWKHSNGTSSSPQKKKRAEVQAITFHAVNRNTVQTRDLCSPCLWKRSWRSAGWRQFLLKAAARFSSRPRRLQRIFQEKASVHFFPVPLDMKILGFTLCELLVLLPPLSRPARVSDWEENCCTWKQDKACGRHQDRGRGAPGEVDLKQTGVREYLQILP